jgi:hypothetical protein
LGSGERLGLDRVGEFSAELRPVFEGVPVAQHEIAVVTVNVGERTKPVVLHLKEPIGMVEGLRKARSGMGRSGWAVPERTLSRGVLGALWVSTRRELLISRQYNRFTATFDRTAADSVWLAGAAHGTRNGAAGWLLLGNDCRRALYPIQDGDTYMVNSALVPVADTQERSKTNDDAAKLRGHRVARAAGGCDAGERRRLRVKCAQSNHGRCLSGP